MHRVPSIAFPLASSPSLCILPHPLLCTKMQTQCEMVCVALRVWGSIGDGMCIMGKGGGGGRWVQAYES